MNFKHISKHSSILVIKIPIKQQVTKLCGVYFGNVCNKASISSLEIQVLASCRKSCSQGHDAADMKSSNKYLLSQRLCMRLTTRGYSTARESKLRSAGEVLSSWRGLRSSDRFSKIIAIFYCNIKLAKRVCESVRKGIPSAVRIGPSKNESFLRAKLKKKNESTIPPPPKKKIFTRTWTAYLFVLLKRRIFLKGKYEGRYLVLSIVTIYGEHKITWRLMN